MPRMEAKLKAEGAIGPRSSHPFAEGSLSSYFQTRDNLPDGTIHLPLPIYIPCIKRHGQSLILCLKNEQFCSINILSLFAVVWHLSRESEAAEGQDADRLRKVVGVS